MSGENIKCCSGLPAGIYSIAVNVLFVEWLPGYPVSGITPPSFFRERTFFWEFPASEPVTYIGTFLFLVAPIPPKSIPFPFLEIPESPVSKKGKKIVFGANILPLEVISKFTGGIFRGKIFSGLHQKKFFWHHAVHAWPSINDSPTPRLHAGTHAYER